MVGNSSGYGGKLKGMLCQDLVLFSVDMYLLGECYKSSKGLNCSPFRTNMYRMIKNHKKYNFYTIILYNLLYN